MQPVNKMVCVAPAGGGCAVWIGAAFVSGDQGFALVGLHEAEGPTEVQGNGVFAEHDRNNVGGAGEAAGGGGGQWGAAFQRGGADGVGEHIPVQVDRQVWLLP